MITDSWHDVVDAEHSWDAADALTIDSYGHWGESGVRALAVPDRGLNGDTPLTPDAGLWAALGHSNPPGPLPGPLHIPHDATLRDRPSLLCDQVGTWDGGAYGLTGPAYSSLGTGLPIPDGHGLWRDPDGIPQPYWTAGLVAIPAIETGGVIDTMPGGITLVRLRGRWSATTNFGDRWPTGPAIADYQSALFVLEADGPGSVLHVTTAAGTTRTPMEMTDRTGQVGWRNLFIGVHITSRISALKVGTGRLDPDEVHALAAWGAQWL